MTLDIADAASVRRSSRSFRTLSRRAARGTLFAAALSLLATSPGEAREARQEREISSSEAKEADLQRLFELLEPEEVEVNLVLVPTLVLDQKGRPLTGLEEEDFSVAVDGEPRPLVWFDETGDRPMKIALLVDVSESMKPPIVSTWLRVALLPLMRHLRTDRDEVMLLSFAAEGVRVDADWNGRPLRTLDKLVELPRGGRTAMHDAIATAASLMPNDPLEREAIVLVTDGLDNASLSTAEEVIRTARGVGTPVYVFALAGPSQVIQDKRSENSPFAPLRQVARETGARIFLIPNGKAAIEAADLLVSDLRHQYVVAFRPDPPPDGRFRAIQIDVDRPDVSVQTRSGYR